MSKCDNCEFRKAIAQAYDLHWMGEDDCPVAECLEADGEEAT